MRSDSGKNGMNEQAYSNLIHLIRFYRTWIDVLDSQKTEVFTAHVSGELFAVSCRVLTLVVRVSSNGFPRGHTWMIPEYMLDRAVRELKRDRLFKQRFMTNDMTKSDAEAIVRLASHRLINLELEE